MHLIQAFLKASHSRVGAVANLEASKPSTIGSGLADSTNEVSASIVSREGLGCASTRPAFRFDGCPSRGWMFSTAFVLAGHSRPLLCLDSICAAPLKPSL